MTDFRDVQGSAALGLGLASGEGQKRGGNHKRNFLHTLQELFAGAVAREHLS